MRFSQIGKRTGLGFGKLRINSMLPDAANKLPDAANKLPVPNN
jgi:hypothetical protein